MGAYYLPRIYVRLAVFGFWTAALGIITLIVSGRFLAASSSRSDGALGAAGFSIGSLIAGAFVSLFEAGLVSMGLGGTMMFGGAWLLVKLP